MSDITRIEEKLDKIIDKQGEMNVTLATNTQSLKEHMKRTDLLGNARQAANQTCRP